MKKTFFKKLLSLTLITLLIISFGLLVSCGADSDEGGSSSDSSESSGSEDNESETTSFKINDVVSYDDAEYSITAVEYTQGSTYDTPADGMEYVIVFISITNNGERNLSYNPYDWKMSNSLGQLNDIAFTIVDSETSLSSGELLPGGSITGTIVFEQPIDDPELKIHYYGNIFDSEPSFEISLIQ